MMFVRNMSHKATSTRPLKLWLGLHQTPQTQADIKPEASLIEATHERQHVLLMKHVFEWNTSLNKDQIQSGIQVAGTAHAGNKSLSMSCQ
jgi:hypothetical protein